MPEPHSKSDAVRRTCRTPIGAQVVKVDRPDPALDRALSLDDSSADACQPIGKLETTLRAGKRVCLVEARPPDGPDLSALARGVEQLAEHVDAVQLTDMPFAVPHVSNLAAGALLAQRGHEVVLNVTCRDRNIIAQQGLLLGAAALGIRNVFCIRGDLPEAGDHPEARGVFELTGLTLVALARSLRDEGRYRSGRACVPRPALFIGAAIAPDAAYGDSAAALTRLKVDAGADFLVTQPVLDTASLAKYYASVAPVLDRTYLLAGIGAITTLTTLEALRNAHELKLSDDFYRRFRDAPESRRADLGMTHALELVDFALGMGANGILVYPFDCTLEETKQLVKEVRRRLATLR
jgi:methylenetetrahydrofolate reductase (NADPH)